MKGPMHGGPGPKMNPGEKPKEFKKTWGKLISYSKQYLPAAILALIFASISTVFIIIGPDKLGEITDIIKEGLLTGIDMQAIAKAGAFLITIYAIGAVLSYLQGFIMATVTQRISKRLRTDISRKINVMPLKYFDSTSFGDVLSRVTNDVDTIGQTMNQSLGTLVSAVTQFIGSLIMMLSTNVTMTIVGIIATLIGFMLMSVIMKHSQKYFLAQQNNLGDINGHVEEIYSGHNIVKVYNNEAHEKAKFEEINSRLCDSSFKSQFFSGMMMPIMNFIGNLGYVSVCITGAILAVNGKITFGVIVSFMMYVRFFTQPLSQMAQASTSLQSTAAASERVFEFLDEQELSDESSKTAKLDTAKGAIEFKNVKFGYDPDKIIIKDFSADVKPGQKIAIVGPTGAGKTTIVNLLMRFYELNAGEIKIDGIPESELTRENIHSLFCMVLQDTWLFEGTIRENIVYSKKGVTEEELVKACKAVGIHHFIMTLPHGYNTVLNDKANLSAGQKQLITIARAMIENAPMLILDEATSSVDTRTEVLIQEAMDKLMAGRTSFVIAHRLSTIKNADLILVMKDGNIIEKGNHEELLAQDGFYAELYNSQFESAS